MARRIRTIVSDEERSKQKLEDLKAILESKNYPKKLVEDGTVELSKITIELLRITIELSRIRTELSRNHN